MAVLTALAIATVVASAATSARGQIKAGKAAKDAGESVAQQQEWNARIADVQAGDAVTRGREAESQLRSQTKSLIGSQRAGFAGQGLDISVGSPVDVQGDTARLGELDALAIRANAQREAWGYRVEGADRRMAAEVARKGGAAAATAARWSAGATVLGGVSDAAQMAAAYKQANKKADPNPVVVPPRPKVP